MFAILPTPRSPIPRRSRSTLQPTTDMSSRRHCYFIRYEPGTVARFAIDSGSASHPREGAPRSGAAFPRRIRPVLIQFEDVAAPDQAVSRLTTRDRSALLADGPERSIQTSLTLL
jgi:hypothetical protein